MEVGRPSLAEQDKTRVLLFKYYMNYKSILYTAEKTGINYKTVWKYFNEFKKLQLEETTNGFIETQKITKGMIIYKLDDLIDRAERQLRKLETLVGYNEEDEDGLLDSGLDITERTRVDSMINKIHGDLINWNQQKGSIESSPTLDIKIEEIVNDRIKELDARELEIEKKEAELNKKT